MPRPSTDYLINRDWDAADRTAYLRDALTAADPVIDFHGYDLYGPQTRVPLIIRVPGLAPRVVDTAAGHVDIMPTLANLAGVPASPQMMGRSLLDWIAGRRRDIDPSSPAQLVLRGSTAPPRDAAVTDQ